MNFDSINAALRKDGWKDIRSYNDNGTYGKIFTKEGEDALKIECFDVSELEVD